MSTTSITRVSFREMASSENLRRPLWYGSPSKIHTLHLVWSAKDKEGYQGNKTKSSHHPTHNTTWYSMAAPQERSPLARFNYLGDIYQLSIFLMSTQENDLTANTENEHPLLRISQSQTTDWITCFYSYHEKTESCIFKILYTKMRKQVIYRRQKWLIRWKKLGCRWHFLVKKWEDGKTRAKYSQNTLISLNRREMELKNWDSSRSVRKLKFTYQYLKMFKNTTIRIPIPNPKLFTDWHEIVRILVK